MRSSRRQSGFAALKLQGGILPPEYLQRVAALEAPRQGSLDYGLSKSLALKDEIARYWLIANDLRRRYSERRVRRGVSAQKVGVDEWLVPLLRTVFGYEDLAPTAPVAVGDRVFRINHQTLGGAAPALLSTRDFDLDRAHSRFGEEGRRRAPHGLLQEYLNAEDASLWGLVSNGAKLRLLRDNPTLTRPAFIQADLDLIFEDELYSDFAALWLAVHASRLRPVGERPSACIIEEWRAEAQDTGQRVLADLRHGVTEALRRLGNGFLRHPENGKLRESLGSGELSRDGYFEQLLRLVYRLLFLFSAEERGLIHAPDASDTERSLFVEGYSVARLRDRALRRRHYDRHADLWLGLRVTVEGLARGEGALGLPPLGGLFRADWCPDMDRALISNRDLLEAVRNLTWFETGSVLARVNYRDMDTEELGSVYESLLELQPVLDVETEPWTFSLAGGAGGGKGSKRKLSGSYYTPPSLVHELVESALGPVIEQAIARRPEDPRSALLELNVLDPACGSGHFLLAAARRIAAEIARIESGADSPDEAARRHALRGVVRSCIHGVDRNPLAVELCKAALWIETVEPGKPLTFLDARIRLGDSLVGVFDPTAMEEGIPAGAYKPLTGDDKALCGELKKQNRNWRQGVLTGEDRLLDVAIGAAELDEMPEGTLEEVERKEKAWRAAQASEARAREAFRANLFTGAFFAPKTGATAEIAPVGEDLLRAAAGDPPRLGVARSVSALAERHRFFHWHLEFPAIMESGGFDVVLGNPPWEVSQLNEEEFFGARAPSVAALPGAARKRGIAELERADPPLWLAYGEALRGYGARNLSCRETGRFPLSAYGKLNSYALFAELMLGLLNDSGRAGFIVPTGIATDHSTKAFFEHLVTERRLVSLFDFENRQRVFPGIDSRIKFSLITLSGAPAPSRRAEFAFFLHQTEQLKERERRYRLGAADFALFNPNTRTCPTFRTRRDMEVARKLYDRAGMFWREARAGEPEDNPWGVSFMQMFNMTSDSGLFRTRAELLDEGWELEGSVFLRNDERCLPLYEAKLFHQYDHRFATFDGASAKDLKGGKARPMTPAEKADPTSVVLPRYWVPAAELEKRLRERGSRTGPGLARERERERKREREREREREPPGARRTGSQLALRQITRATDERTAVFGVIPLVALGHSAATIMVGCLSSGTSRARRISEPPSSRAYLRPV